MPLNIGLVGLMVGCMLSALTSSKSSMMLAASPCSSRISTGL